MTRMKMFLMAALALAMAAPAAWAQRSGGKSYVIQKTTGKKFEGTVTAAPNGRLTVTMDKGTRMFFNPGQYTVVSTPKPEDVEKLEDLLDDESYNELTRTAPAVFEKYKYLGWADTVARLHCEGLMALGKKDDAEKFLAIAKKMPRENDFNVTSVELQLLVHDRKLGEVEKKLADMLTQDDDAVSAFVFNMRGRVFELSGKKKEAVLQYLKTFLTFEDKKKVRRFRKEAKASALRLMKELQDPAAQNLEQLR